MREIMQAIAAKYKDEIVKTASELIQINSQSLHEGEMAAYVQEKMRTLGYDEVAVDRYGSVFGTVRGTGGGCSVTLNCHMDVVDAGDPARWKRPPYGGVIEEGRIWGRGLRTPRAPWLFRFTPRFSSGRRGCCPRATW